jgi:putative heme-binding domain-containing protein
VANLAAYVRSLSKIPSEPLPGDTVRGARVYANGGCSNCHIVAGAGFGYGPELSNIGIRRSAPYIRKAVVKPGATMPEGFLLVEATTPAGDKIEGIRVNEDTFSIQIKDATGQFHSLRKQDLKELQKLRGETPMPSYEGVFNTSELDDLVAYLASLGGKQ